MSVTLPTELEEFVSERVANGDYPSAEAVDSAGIELLRAQERQRDELRRDIDAAIQQIERGEYFEYDAASLDVFFEELKEKTKGSVWVHGGFAAPVVHALRIPRESSTENSLFPLFPPVQ